MTNSPTETIVLDDKAINRIQSLPVTMNGNIVAVPSVALSREERDALCQTVRVLKQIGLHNAQIVDRIRLWSKCEDSYPLDEHINNITVDRERLRASRRVHELDNHHNALACGYCAGPIKDESARLQSQLEQLRAENERLKEHVNQIERELRACSGQ